MDTGRISEGAGGSPGFVSSVSDKGGNPVSSCSESYSVSTVPKPPLNGAAQADFPLVFPETYEPGDPPSRGPWKQSLEALRRGRFGNENASRRTAFFQGYDGPNTTLCMIRPGSSVNSPAITSAPEKMKIMMRR